MRRINLLPTARRRGSVTFAERLIFLQNLPPRTWAVGMGALAFAVAILLVVTVLSQRRLVSNRIEVVEGELRELRVIVDEVNGLRTLKQTLDQKMNVVDRLIIGRTCWARFFNRIAFVLNENQQIAKRVWLTSMELAQIREIEERQVEKKDSKGNITTETQRVPVIRSVIKLRGAVSGEEGTSALVGTLMKQLDDDEPLAEYIEDVDLSHIKDSAARTGGNKEFELTLLLRKQ